MRKTRVLAVIAGLLVVIGVASSFYLKSSRQESDGPMSTEPRNAAAFELKTSQGKVYKLADFKGSVTLVHFWASWCPPCIEEIPQIREFAKSYGPKGLKIVAISLDDGWPEALKMLPDSENPANLISLLDPSKELPDAYGSYQYPETYILNKDLKIVAKLIGPQEWGNEKLLKFIDGLL